MINDRVLVLHARFWLMVLLLLAVIRIFTSGGTYSLCALILISFVYHKMVSPFLIYLLRSLVDRLISKAL